MSTGAFSYNFLANMAKNISRRKSEHGQSLAELAVSFLVLVLLLAVTVDAGRAFFSFLAIREAAEEGAIYGSTIPDDASFSDKVTDRVVSSSNQLETWDAEGSVTVTPIIVGTACADGSNQVQVTVRYMFSLTMPFVSAIIGTNQFPLELSATSTILTPACP